MSTTLINLLLSGGWLGPLFTALIIIVSGIYINRRAKSDAEKVARTAYEGAISAMQAHIHALQMRMKDLEIENKQLKQTLEKLKKTIHLEEEEHTPHTTP